MILSVLATFLVCIGSLVVILAPGDGQTGMVAFPLWLAGGVLWLVSFGLAMFSERNLGPWWSVVVLGLLSRASVHHAFKASTLRESQLDEN